MNTLAAKKPASLLISFSHLSLTYMHRVKFLSYFIHVFVYVNMTSSLLKLLSYVFQNFNLTVTSEEVCLDIRNVKSVKGIPVFVLRLFSLMHVTAVCVLNFILSVNKLLYQFNSKMFSKPKDSKEPRKHCKKTRRCTIFR